jgi:PAS domain S-box-containing protein
VDQEGEPLRDSGGNPVLECMCGNILQGRFDPAKPFFSPRGSFWTNSTTELLASTTEADRQARTRNRCHGEGYESVALIPVRTTGETLGLLQFNDPRPGRFTPEKIARLEQIADHLASSFARWQADQARKRSDESLRLAAAAARFGTYSYDFTNGAAHWSPEFKALLGLKPDEALPLDQDKLFTGLHPEDRAEFLAAMTAANDPRGNGLLRLDYRVLHPDGAVCWLQVRGLTTFAGKGRARHPERAAGVVLDITERKLAEAKLRESEAAARARGDDLATVMAATPAITFIAEDRECRRMTNSHAALRLLRLPPGSNTSKSAPPGERPETFRVLKDGRELRPEELPVQRAAATGQAVRNFELPLVFDDGTTCSLLGDAVPLFDAEGKVRGAVGVFLDITERKLAENSLRASEDRFRSLVETSPDAVLLTAPDGRILSANEAACRMFGRSEAELIQVGRSGVVNPSDPRLTAALQERAETGRFRGDLTFVRKDGSTFPGEVSSAVFTDQRGELRTSMVIHDTTGRKQAEEALSRSREALRALAARIERVREDERTRIAREVHDELGHTMTDLRLDLAWLSRRLGEAGFAGRSSIRERVKAMSQRVVVGAQTVRRIATELRPAVLDALGLAAAIEWQSREFQQRARIKCEIQIPDTFPVIEAPRSTAVFRIFQEILNNVVLHASASQVKVRLTARQGRLLLRVSDNGRGMAQMEQSSPSALGLLGIRERATLLGGGVRIASAPNRGTTITVSIPDAAP